MLLFTLTVHKNRYKNSQIGCYRKFVTPSDEFDINIETKHYRAIGRNDGKIANGTDMNVAQIPITTYIQHATCFFGNYYRV